MRYNLGYFFFFRNGELLTKELRSLDTKKWDNVAESLEEAFLKAYRLMDEPVKRLLLVSIFGLSVVYRLG